MIRSNIFNDTPPNEVLDISREIAARYSGPLDAELSACSFIFSSLDKAGEPVHSYINELPVNELVMNGDEAQRVINLVSRPDRFYVAGYAEQPKKVKSNFSEDVIVDYLKSTDNVALLTKAGEQLLGRAIMAGQQLILMPNLSYDDPALYRNIYDAAVTAYLHMINANKKLAATFANRHKGSLPADVAISAANEGLIHAVIKFDYRMGFKFSTYANRWIRQAVGRARDQYTLGPRLPEQVSQARRRLQQDMVDFPEFEYRSNPQVAERLGISVEKLHELVAIYKANKDPISLDLPVNDHGEKTYADELPAAEVEDRHETVSPKSIYASVAKRLPEPQRTLLGHHPLLAGLIDTSEQAMEEAAAKLKIKPGRAKNIAREALAMFMHPVLGMPQAAKGVPAAKELEAATCEGQDVTVFFPNNRNLESTDAADYRRQLCEGCVARAACREYAQKNAGVIKAGYWAGVSLYPKTNPTTKKDITASQDEEDAA